jgi:glycosyltransferase involved in cell wall biosynthesis
MGMTGRATKDVREGGAGRSGPARRAVWAYDLEHLLHPFILLGVETLVEAGWDVTVVSADKAAKAPYRSLDGFSYARRERNHRRLIVEARGRIAAKIERLQARREQAGPVARLALGAAASAFGLWSEIVRRYALARHFTWENWRIHLRGFSQLMRLDGEVMIASRPQSALWACLAAKARGMRLVYYPFELYGEQVVPPSPMIAALERFMLRRLVDAVITQNSCRAAVLRDERGARAPPLIVHNYKRRSAVRPAPSGRLRAALGIEPGRRIVLYEGYLVQGRWLEHLAQAALHLPEDVVVVMMGQEKLKWRKLCRKPLKAPLASGRLIFAPPVPQDELIDDVSDADVGVIIYDDAVRNNVFCEPGKLSDYIAAGVPIVAPNRPTLGPLIEGRGLGLCFEGHAPEAIAATLLQALARPRESWRPALERAAAELTWESQAPVLLAAVAGEAAPAPAANPLIPAKAGTQAFSAPTAPSG